MTDFVQTMHDWKRMCEYFEEHYDYNCCDHCPLKSCGAIWEMEMDGRNWGKFEEKIATWAAENPEPKYPTWREYLKEMGLIKEEDCQYTEHYSNSINVVRMENAAILNEKADEPISPEIAEKLGLKPQY